MKFTIVAGAPCKSPDFIRKTADRDSFVIAADSGYLNCISAGIVPDLIIGDFDSSPQPQQGDCAEIMTFPPVKDYTDTLCCIKEAIRRGADEIELFCALGGRTDHTYSNIVSLWYCLEHGVKASLLSEKNIISLHNSSFTASKGGFKYFSVFAFGGPVEGLSIKGAAYELNDFYLSPYSSIGQSNEFKSGRVDINFKSGLLLFILSND